MKSKCRPHSPIGMRITRISTLMAARYYLIKIFLTNERQIQNSSHGIYSPFARLPGRWYSIIPPSKLIHLQNRGVYNRHLLFTACIPPVQYMTSLLCSLISSSIMDRLSKGIHICVQAFSKWPISLS
jgi:hypothetical protein